MKKTKPNKKRTMKPNFIIRVLLLGVVIYSLVNNGTIEMNDLVGTIVLGSIEKIEIPKRNPKKEKGRSK